MNLAQIGQAAVEHQGGAGDELAVGAGEEGDRAADVGLRVADTAQWDDFSNIALGVGSASVAGEATIGTTMLTRILSCAHSRAAARLIA